MVLKWITQDNRQTITHANAYITERERGGKGQRLS